MGSVSEPKLSPQQRILKTEANEVSPPFSIFSRWEKTIYVYTASLAGFASPVSSSIYYPALNLLARDLHTSLSNINLTITTYLVHTTALGLSRAQLTNCLRYVKLSHLPFLAAFQIGLVDDQPTSSASSFTWVLTPVSLCKPILWHCSYYECSRVVEAVVQ